MASIIKRKKNYSVVYNYVDENGETKQKWETWHTHKEALKRKAEIENQQHTGTFLPPSNQTITEFLYDFVSLYGEKKWGVSILSEVWREIERIFRSSLKEKPEDEDGGADLPELTEGQTFDNVFTEITEHYTQPPKPFTEAICCERGIRNRP